MPAEEQAERPMGIDLIIAGKCPLDHVSAAACMFCGFGHMTECHYPQDCEEANCSHFRGDEEDGFSPDEDQT